VGDYDDFYEITPGAWYGWPGIRSTTLTGVRAGRAASWCWPSILTSTRPAHLPASPPMPPPPTEVPLYAIEYLGFIAALVALIAALGWLISRLRRR
jgi:hypothetical protein